MKISKMIEELEDIKKREGDIEVTCRWSTTRPKRDAQGVQPVFETTVENFLVREEEPWGKHVKVCL